jgi:hypothetical protein
MAGITHHHAGGIAPLGNDGVARARDRASEHIETGPEIPNARGSEGANTPRERAHDDASARMSFNTPAAVTAGPAPGPVMINGFVW